MRFILTLSFLLFLSACSGGGEPVPPQKGPGSILTGKSEQGVSLSDITGGGGHDSNAGLPVNALLWRAALDITSVLPLDDIDTFGGTIVTEWYQLNERADERIKLAVFVLDKELRSDGIRVVVYLQKKQQGSWADNGTDNEMGLRLEELILTRARELRAATVQETQ